MKRHQSSGLAKAPRPNQESHSVLLIAVGLSVLLHLVFSFIAHWLEQQKQPVIQQLGYQVSLSSYAQTPQKLESETSSVESVPDSASSAQIEPANQAQVTNKKNAAKTEPKKTPTKTNKADSNKNTQIPMETVNATEPPPITMLKPEAAQLATPVITPNDVSKADSNAESETNPAPDSQSPAKSATLPTREISIESDTDREEESDKEAIPDTSNNAPEAETQDSGELISKDSVPTERRYKLGSVNNPDPAYPNIARKRGFEGDVLLGVHVAPDGSIAYLEILKGSGFSALDFAAYTTVREQWQFDPMLELDQLEVIKVPISFRLQ